MRATRRNVLSLIAAATVTGIAGRGRPALAETLTCPMLAGRTITWIVPYSAGGNRDASSRLLAAALGTRTGTEVAVQNVVGAGGLLGTRRLSEAPPTGRVLGAINPPGLIMADLVGAGDAAHPIRDLRILAQMYDVPHVWVTSSDSGFESIDDLLEAAEERSLVAGISGPGGGALPSLVIGARTLDVEIKLVPGYRGVPDAVMSLIRGEVDVISYPYWGPIRHHIAAGELRPLLQVSDAPIGDPALLADVPLYAGPDGVAARRARERGLDAEQNARLAEAIVPIVRSNAVVAAPPGLDPELAACLERALLEALDDPEFVEEMARLGVPVAAADAAEVEAQLEAAMDGMRLIAPHLQEAITALRG